MFSKRSLILISSKKTIPSIPKTSSFSNYSRNQSSIFNRKSLFSNSMSSSSKSPGPIQKTHWNKTSWHIGTGTSWNY